MLHLLHLVLTGTAFLAGVFCVLTAILLYPGEEGKIQSKFEDFWVRADDYQRMALSRHAAFMTQVAKLESAFLDRVFGPKLFSPQSIVVSCWSSVVSFILSGSLLRNLTHVAVVFPNPVLAGLLIGLSLASIAYILLPNHRLARGICLYAAAAIVGYTGALFVQLTPKTGLASWSVTYLALFIGGFCCDVLFIAATRRLVRWVGEMTRVLTMVSVLTINVLLAVAMVAPVAAWQLPSVSRLLFTRWWFVVEASMAIWSSNLFDSLFAFVFVVLAAVLLVHRALWPVLTRTLFRMSDIGTTGRRGILITVGLALLGWSGVQLPDLLKELVKGLATG
jgi:hypothetical protein